jgi:hypothetical protein
MKRINKLLAALESKKCLKTIAGISNFDKSKVLQLVKASEAMGADCVDICADRDIITAALAELKDTALVVSSINVSDLQMAEELGADVLELGNFEALHDQGIFPSAEQVLEWAQQIIAIKGNTLVSITIPGHLTIAEQVNLASKLEDMGVDILQTEGASLSQAKSASVLGQIEKASLTLANTIEIARTVSRTYILTASGLTPETVRLAIAAGASGVGIGHYVNKLETELEQMAAIRAIKEKLATASTALAL